MTLAHKDLTFRYTHENTTRKNKRFLTRAGNRRNVERLAYSIKNLTLTRMLNNYTYNVTCMRYVHIDLYLSLLQFKRM